MAPKICDHHVARTVRGQLSITGCCPSCVMNHHMAEIRSTQKGLQHRGGIFASKEKAMQEGSIQCKRHRAWIRKWKLAKIKCAKDVDFLETLKNANREMVKEEGIEAALEMWERAREECSRIPGCIYLEDNNAETAANVLDEYDYDRCNAEKSSHDLSVKQPIDVSNTTNYYLNKTIRDEMNAVVSRLEQNLRLSPNTGVDNQTVQAVQQSPGDYNPLPACSTTQAQFQHRDLPLKTAIPPPHSVLKRVAPSNQSTKTCPNSRVLIDELVTTIGSLLLDLGVDQSFESLHRHNTHTDAFYHRPPTAFHRRSVLYEPATWRSPAGFKKINASHCKTDWEMYETLAETGDEDMDTETGEDNGENEGNEEHANVEGRDGL